MTDVDNNVEETDLLPDDVTFNDSDVERDMSRPKLRGGTYYRFKVTGAKNRVSDHPKSKGDISIELMVNPLDPDGKTRGPSSRLKLKYPFANNKVQGHTAPNWAWAWEKFCKALYPDKYVDGPTRNKDGTWRTADGTIVTKEEANAIEKGIKRDIRLAAQSYYRNPAETVDEVFFAQVKDDDYRDVEVKTVCSELPPGVEARMSDFADTQ